MINLGLDEQKALIFGLNNHSEGRPPAIIADKHVIDILAIDGLAVRGALVFLGTLTAKGLRIAQKYLNGEVVDGSHI